MQTKRVCFLVGRRREQLAIAINHTFLVCSFDDITKFQIPASYNVIIFF
jgi:hypothetical protein